jgi:hypothetical protein
MFPKHDNSDPAELDQKSTCTKLGAYPIPKEEKNKHHWLPSSASTMFARPEQTP